MTYKFKYHPDGWIGINGLPVYPDLSSFLSVNPNFPITGGMYFEYGDEFEIIKELSPNSFSGIIQEDLTPYQDLITAINNLGV